VILLDVNVLVHAFHEASPEHPAYRAWLEATVEADEPFGLSELVLSVTAGAKGNRVADAYLAALAIESGCEWITGDRDFSRLPGLRWRHPLADA